MKKFLKVLFLIFSFSIPTLSNAGTVYYIDFDNGNDNASGLTTSTPWKTLPGTRKADDSDYLRSSWGNGTFTVGSKRVSPGTTFRLKSGTTYSITDGGGHIWLHSYFYEDTATAANPITIERDPNWGSGSVIIDGAGMNIPIALLLTQINGLTVDGKGANGIIFQNSALEGIEAKEKGGDSAANLDLTFKDLKFFNNGTSFQNDLAGSGSGQLDIRKAVGVTVDRLELDGNHRFINGLMMGDNHKPVIDVLVTNTRAYNHQGDLVDNDSGIGFKIQNGQATFRNCESFRNLKGWDLGEQAGENTNLIYKVINVQAYDNAWGINFTSSAKISDTADNHFYLINSIIRNNSQWGSNVYSGPYHIYIVNNVYAHNGNNSFDAGNLRISPNEPSDVTSIQAYVFNNIFYKPNTTLGQNYMNTTVGDALSPTFDTNFSLTSDYNAWIQNGTERFARWNAFGYANRDFTGNYEFFYGANGPGHASGLWYAVEDEPGKGSGHVGADAHSKGTGAADATLPPFANLATNDFSLTQAYPGKNLTSFSWYINEMGKDLNGNPRTTWNMGAHETPVAPSILPNAPARLRIVSAQ